MPALRAFLHELISSEGPISLDRYMSLCLGHPEFGYYMRKDPFGRGGDFITAPEISQIFGELIGLWAISVWDQMGRPDRLALVELGPGRGTLMADALRVAKVVPEFVQALDVHLIEMSPVLRQMQKAALAPSGARVRWHGDIGDVPDGPAIILANEFFDALPIRQIVRTDKGWHERLIGLNGADALCFGLARDAYPIDREAPEGSIVEICAPGQAIMTQLAGRIMRGGGAVLAIDYGYAKGSGDSFQAMQGHRYVDPLADPGAADLTAHVDFGALARSAQAAGGLVHPVLTQATFLQRMGIDIRASRLKQGAPHLAGDIDRAVQRLSGTGKGEMGQLFKALCVSQAGLTSIPAFDSPDGLMERLGP